MHKEQKLIDIMFEVGLTIQSDPWFKDKTQEEVAEWISSQLNSSGFSVTPCGASWGILRTE